MGNHANISSRLKSRNKHKKRKLVKQDTKNQGDY